MREGKRTPKNVSNGFPEFGGKREHTVGRTI